MWLWRCDHSFPLFHGSALSMGQIKTAAHHHDHVSFFFWAFDIVKEMTHESGFLRHMTSLTRRSFRRKEMCFESRKSRGGSRTVIIHNTKRRSRRYERQPTVGLQSPMGEPGTEAKEGNPIPYSTVKKSLVVFTFFFFLIFYALAAA